MNTHSGEGADPRGAPADEGDLASLVKGNLSTGKAPAWKVLSWGMWDWGTQPFATVITTFVFSVYLTSSAFGDNDTTSMALV